MTARALEFETADGQARAQVPAAWRAALTLAREVLPGATITLPAATLLAVDRLLDAAPNAVPQLGTVGDLARRYTVSESTARGWLHAGRVPGAVCLPRLGWRFELAALGALDRSLAHPAPVSLGEWRRPRGT